MGRKNRNFTAKLARSHAVELTAQDRHFAEKELGRNAVAFRLDATGTRALFKALAEDGDQQVQNSAKGRGASGDK